MAPFASSPDDSDALLAEIVEEFTDRAQAGEAVDVESYVRKHPEYAERLRRLLPALALLDDLARSLSPGSSALAVSRGGAPAGVLGDFRILREVGKGGMGVVYEAEQISLRRRVALKVLPFAATLDPRHLQRFHNEARAAACLDHPHIVRVHAVGCERGVHYFAMKFVEGQSLAEFLAGLRRELAGADGPKSQATASEGAQAPGGPMNATRSTAAATTQRAPRDAAHHRRIAEWGIQAAEVLEHAHGLGIVHRDIKPSNLMIDGAGRLWVTDFGLARTPTDAGLTMTGDVLGTLRYMSPEQALARHGLVDHRTDIYALGATLYELLALRPAIDGNDREEILRRIAFDEPAPLRSLDRAIPADLETIVRKALAKEPAERYATAQELADDLRRYCEGRPIQARPVRRWVRLWRWCRRNPPLASLAACSLSLLLVVVVGSVVSAFRIEAQRERADRQRERPERREAELRRQLYPADMRRAEEEWERGNVEQMREVLRRYDDPAGPEDLRTFAWHYLWRLCQESPAPRTLAGHRGDVYAVAFAPDGRTLASAGQDGTVRLWDASSGRPQLTIRASTQDINSVAFSPDGATLATAGDDAVVRLWEAKSGMLRAELREPDREVVAVAFSPDGRTLAAGGDDGIVRLWECATGRVIDRLDARQGRIDDLAFSPDGKTLACACNRLVVWDLARRQTHAAPPSTGEILAVAYGHHGRLLASRDHFVIRLRDAATTASVGAWARHAAPEQSLAFSPDDRLLASASDDGVLHLWDVTHPGQLRGLFRVPARRLWCVSISSDGHTLACAGSDGAVRLFDLRRYQPVKLPPATDSVIHVTLSTDGQLVAASCSARIVCIWDVSTGKLVRTLLPPEVPVRSLAFSPDGRTLLIGTADGTVSFWDTATGKSAGKSLRHAPGLNLMVWSPGGRWIVTLDAEARPRLWEASSGKLLRTFEPHASAFCFSPDERLLAEAQVAASEGVPRVRLWTIPAGEQQHVWTVPHSRSAHALAFSPDGRLLAWGGEDGALWVWDTVTGERQCSLAAHRSVINRLAFAPEGETLASASWDGDIKLWDVRTWQEAATLRGYAGTVETLTFRPAGRTLVSVHQSGQGAPAEVWLWSADGEGPGQENEPTAEALREVEKTDGTKESGR